MNSAVSAASSSIVLKKFMRTSAPCGSQSPAPYDRARATPGEYMSPDPTEKEARRAAAAARALAEAEARRAATKPPERCRASSAAATARSRCASATGSAAASRSTSDGPPLGAAMKQVICISWGPKYGAPYVNRLYAMVARNLTPPFSFTCFTDDAGGLPGRDPGRAAAAARRGDADRHQGHLAEGAALERGARRPRGAGAVHGPRPRRGRLARRLLQLRRRRTR